MTDQRQARRPKTTTGRSQTTPARPSPLSRVCDVLADGNWHTIAEIETTLATQPAGPVEHADVKAALRMLVDGCEAERAGLTPPRWRTTAVETPA